MFWQISQRRRFGKLQKCHFQVLRHLNILPIKEPSPNCRFSQVNSVSELDRIVKPITQQLPVAVHHTIMRIYKMVIAIQKIDVTLFSSSSIRLILFADIAQCSKHRLTITHCTVDDHEENSD
jgi:hypothetical protein